MLSATFHKTVGERQPTARSPRALLFCQVTDSQIFFRIQRAKMQQRGYAIDEQT